MKCRYCGATVLVPPRLGGLLQLCPNHPESLSVGICNDCGKSFCGDCLFVTKIVGSGEGAQKGYFNFCSNCMKKREEREKAGWIVASAISLIFMFFPGLLIMSIPGGGISGLIMILMGFFFLLLPLFVKHKELPTVRRVMEKISELNKRAEKVKAAMSPQEVEELYKDLYIRMLSYQIDPWTGKRTEESKIDSLLEKYIQYGLNRKEAIFKIASEQGVEIKHGLHIPPTIDDALSELKKEMKKKIEEAELAKLEEAELSKTSEKLYEQLLYNYTHFSGGGKRGLDRKIESYVKRGLSRDEAIFEIAKKEKILPKEK